MIILLVVVGITLSLVVLYNLGVMSYTERYREMAVHIEGSTYAISTLLCVGVTLFIALMISRKNKKIDMVEALKSSE